MESDRDFLVRFESGTLPAAAWNHEARLRATFLLLRAYGFPEATRRMRIAIHMLSARENAVAGAHETLTLAWARLIEQARADDELVSDFATFLARHPELGRRDRVLEHYSPERLDSQRARREFVLPDRAPLPAPPPRPRVSARQV